MAKRFIANGSEAAVTLVRRPGLADALVEVWLMPVQMAYTAGVADAYTGISQGSARQGLLQLILAATCEAWGMDAKAAKEYPLLDGVPLADMLYQCMRMARKTLTTTAAALPGEQYAGAFNFACTTVLSTWQITVPYSY